ncbi:type II secretion system F family protein [Halopiger xanaduensis]|uniref:Type II secretion system F domain protein n=1 Tax=Halopiger xanaduensis (strain DSM 18323 / JCM 14033 / SH-6) TaxID=797210 RepID=F8DBQ3_HALXS|nr:type II secretion system F family protein [Halopiger xanaduensis]AEH38321.1 Type II secretion system F domain protein [Halopiger xanaduensis SH-6]
MPLSNFLPLAVAAGLCSLVVLAQVHAGLDRTLTRAAIGLFGGYVAEFKGEHPNRQSALRAAHFATTYREYGATTMLYAMLFAVAGSIVGIYVVWGLLFVLAVDPAAMREALPGTLAFLANLGGVPSLSPTELFGLFALSCLTIGTVAGFGAYWLRWWYPSYVADGRTRRIETGLPSTVAFMYALSRSGMEFPKIVRILARHEDTYGEAAAEFGVAVRNMDTFGMDVITALQTTGRRSPSPKFADFVENLVSVLQSGNSLSTFLETQYRDFQEESESQQESTIELLGTLAEAYVTVLVAGPLFLITILVVIGISVGNTFDPLRALIYLILPLGNVAFIVYLSMVTDTITPGGVAEPDSDADEAAPTPVVMVREQPRADGGRNAARSTSSRRGREQRNLERVRYYRRLQRLRERVGSPLTTLRERPRLSLVLTVPVALAAVLWRLPAAITDQGFDVTAVDDVVAVGALFVVAVFAGCYELHRRRIEATEGAIPDLLERLASVNDAGMPLVSAIDQVRGSDLGTLGAELDRIWADVQWGADLQTALERFGRRVRTRATSRVVTLVTEAMNASGNLATVLTIAARQAAADRRLKRERKQAMVEYLVVVYIAFFVFLFIITVLAAFLLPNLPTEGIEAASGGSGGGGGGGGIDGLGGLSQNAAAQYNTLFYHATLVQGLLSGLIAGQLSTGDVRAGAKHAAAMLALSVLLFAVVV